MVRAISSPDLQGHSALQVDVAKVLVVQVVTAGLLHVQGYYNKVAAFPPEVALTPKSGWVTVLVIKSGYRCQCQVYEAPSVHYNALVAPLSTKH